MGSDPIGRTASLLTELPVDVQPYGWRFVDRIGLDFRRAESALSTDINVLADVVGDGDLSPEALKVQVVGPSRWPRPSTCTMASDRCGTTVLGVILASPWRQVWPFTLRRRKPASPVLR